MTPEELAKYGPTNGMSYSDCDIPLNYTQEWAKEAIKELQYIGYNLYYMEYQYVDSDYVRVTLYRGSAEW